MAKEHESGVRSFYMKTTFVRAEDHGRVVVSKFATHFARFLHAKIIPRPFNSVL